MEFQYRAHIVDQTRLWTPFVTQNRPKLVKHGRKKQVVDSQLRHGEFTHTWKDIEPVFYPNFVGFEARDS